MRGSGGGRSSALLILVLAAGWLPSCAGTAPSPSPTPTPAPTPITSRALLHALDPSAGLLSTYEVSEMTGRLALLATVAVPGVQCLSADRDGRVVYTLDESLSAKKVAFTTLRRYSVDGRSGALALRGEVSRSYDPYSLARGEHHVFTASLSTIQSGHGAHYIGYFHAYEIRSDGQPLSAYRATPEGDFIEQGPPLDLSEPEFTGLPVWLHPEAAAVVGEHFIIASGRSVASFGVDATTGWLRPKALVEMDSSFGNEPVLFAAGTPDGLVALGAADGLWLFAVDAYRRSRFRPIASKKSRHEKTIGFGTKQRTKTTRLTRPTTTRPRPTGASSSRVIGWRRPRTRTRTDQRIQLGPK